MKLRMCSVDVSMADTHDLREVVALIVLMGCRALQLLKTVSITTTSLASEAFLDARAALLFHVPKDLEGRAYFAMPVMITNVPDLTAVNCTDTGGFSGVLIWRLSFSYNSRDGFSDSVAVQRLAAVPAWFVLDCLSASLTLAWV